MRRKEVFAISTIALPLIAAYMGEYAMLLTTKLVVGGLGYRELAAVGIANVITFEVLMVFMGLLSVVGVFIAQAEVVADKTRAGHATRQGLLYAALLGIPLTLVVWHLGSVLRLLGQEASIVELAIPYVHAMAASVLPILWFNVLRSYVAALARPRAMMVITLIGVAINYGLTIILVRGTAVTPAFGVAGAGWSLSIVSWLMLAALIAHIASRNELRGYGLFRGQLKIDWRIWRELTVLGVPVAGLVVIEGGMFMFVSILSGLMGAKTLAAYEILMAWVGFPFVIGLGIAEATMVRVAYGTGLNDLSVARRSGITGMMLGSAILLLMVVFPVMFPEQIVNLFIDPGDPDSADVGKMAIGLLMIVAIFQVFDGLQVIASRALRACKDTMIPLVLAGIGYWVFGVGGGSVLAFVFDWGAAGLWWGMAAGLIITGSLLAWRFVRLTDSPLPMTG